MQPNDRIYATLSEVRKEYPGLKVNDVITIDSRQYYLDEVVSVFLDRRIGYRLVEVITGDTQQAGLICKAN